MGWRRGQAYGQDLRDRVLAADGPVHEVARRFAVSESYVARARSRQLLGQVSAGVQCNHVPLRLQGLEGALSERVAAAPEQTLAQLCQWVEAEHEVRVSLSTMWKTLGRLGLTLKKSMVTPVFAIVISDEYWACLNLSGVRLEHAPRHDESRAWRS